MCVCALLPGLTFGHLGTHSFIHVRKVLWSSSSLRTWIGVSEGGVPGETVKVSPTAVEVEPSSTSSSTRSDDVRLTTCSPVDVFMRSFVLPRHVGVPGEEELTVRRQPASRASLPGSWQQGMTGAGGCETSSCRSDSETPVSRHSRQVLKFILGRSQNYICQLPISGNQPDSDSKNGYIWGSNRFGPGIF